MFKKLLMSGAALALSAGVAQADFTLNVLHRNDVHSRVGPNNKSDSSCGAEDAVEGKCFGGMARVATKINELRDGIKAAGGNVITLDAGDQFHGSMIYNTYKGSVAAEHEHRRL